MTMLIIVCVSFQRSKTQKRGDDKERRKRSPSPQPTKIHLGRLTRNVTKVCTALVKLGYLLELIYRIYRIY